VPVSPIVSASGSSASIPDRAGLSERELSATQQQLRQAAQGPENSHRNKPARSTQSANRTGPAKPSGVSRRKKSEPGVMRREIDSW